MKNKLLYGLLGAGALAGVYFYQKRKKETTLPILNEDLDSAKSAPTSVFSSEEVENLSKQFADETIAVAKKELERLQFLPVLVTDGSDKKNIKKPTSSIFNLNKDGVLFESLNRFRASLNNDQMIMERLLIITKSYGDLYKMYKKSIPNFDNMSDLVLAKDLLIKTLVFDDRDSRIVPTKEEQIFLANAESNKALMMFPESFGFDIRLLNIFSNRGSKQVYKV